MATIKQIADAIEVRLGAVDGLRVASEPDPALRPPLAWPAFTGWQPISSGRAGWFTATFDIYVFTGTTARFLDGYRDLLEFANWSGTRSIYLALWDGNDLTAGTFGGLSNTTFNIDTGQGFRLLGTTEVDAFDMNGGVFSIEIHTKG